ncbi:hypothetical protein GCM10008018_72860 [Paenibacillus marchantiophytorum]|uniref:Uncharacterized protein n=1 Tax=Paenibacillus marchantiophytorum TaxID=1619310 RepID=A0ABQ1FKZ4_9BACL|nr:hypothetical protein [Paenibacillus marchantiophytorum]GGA18366.1 hypothetical protein GCM10008018_72860 [Paenibacillus marchantiophytorum]
MNLKIHLLEGYVYRAVVKSVPLVLEISSEKEESISDKIDFKEVMLYIDGKETFGSFIVSTLSLPKYTYTISENTPKFMIVNIAEYDESELLPGEYEINITIVIYEPLTDGKYKRKELKAVKEITIK